MKKMTSLFAIGIAAWLAVIAIWVFVPKTDFAKLEGEMFDNVRYDGLTIECIQTDEIVTQKYQIGKYSFEDTEIVASGENEHIVFECTATDPIARKTYPVNIEVTTGADLYLYWSTCNVDDLIMKASVVFYNSKNDIVLEETLECVNEFSI
ncbi:MAG: hypothetical protein F4227_00040 [Gammaproteobacteria bacterium]|nr:hypothetical protein [Gammaproteobacteria bacterium]MYF01407.1 hypothetical protein [Gammaproteobacteria bacterium]